MRGAIRGPIFILTAAGIFVSSYAGAADKLDLKFKAGGSERIRQEYTRDITDLNSSGKDNRNYFRFRTSLWGQVDFNKDTDLYTKLTNENRAYMYWGGASASAGKSAGKKGYHYDINETVFDNLYFDVRNLLGFPLDLRLGRQDLDSYGEGFILKDGTPLDGTRTFYFNAVKAVWRINEKNSLDLLAIKDAKTDEMLPVINKVDGKQQLNSSKERAIGLYHKTDSFKDLRWENYYLYKEEEGAGAARMTAKETRLHTVGSFAKYTFSPWTLRGQIAGQFGRYGCNDREGLGGYIFVDREFKEAIWSPQLSGGFTYLSGDNKSTPKNEAWDPLFSRDAWYSTLYSTYLASETETSYWTNLQIYRASLTFNPLKKLKAIFWYNYLRANDQVAPTATLFSGKHKDRGHLPQAKIEYAFNKNITTYFLAEYFIPGDFYVKTADDALFLRTELSIKF